MKRLMIVADHSLVVQAIRLALRQTAGFQVVGFVDGRQSIRARWPSCKPDIVLVDDMQVPEHALARLREVGELAAGRQAHPAHAAHGRRVARRGLRGRRRAP